MTRGLRVWGAIWPLLPVLACCAHGLGQDSGVTSSSTALNQYSFIQGQSGSAPHTIRGTVVNSVTGEPIYRALVQIGGQYAALTDHEGRFEFEGVEAGNVPPWAMKPGYFSENRPPGFPASFQAVSGGFGGASTTSGDQPVLVKLVPEAIVTGTVTGQDGAPLEGIPVQMKVLAIQDGMPLWRQRQGTRTNSEGQYRFAELEAGKYVVTTGFHTEGLADARGSLAYVPARYPPPAGGSSSAESTLVLGPGDHTQADLSPEVEKLYPVTGTIAGYGEGRGVSFRVETGSGEEIAPVSRFNARTGEFRLMLPGGTYQVTATAFTRQGSMEARREVTVPQAPVSGVSFTMEPYATIPVDLEFETVNQPAEGTGQASATAPQTYTGPNIGLTSVNGTGRMQFLSALPIRQPGSDDPAAPPGPLRIENVSPGRYLLRAQAQPPWYVSSASCGSVDLTREELTIVGGVAGCSIRVVLRNDSGSVHATIRDEDGGLPAQRPLSLYALPIGDLTRSEVGLHQQGTDFTAEGLAPGRYLVLALDHPQELPYRDAEAMRPYAGMGQEVTVTPNGKADVEVSLAAKEQ